MNTLLSAPLRFHVLVMLLSVATAFPALRAADPAVVDDFASANQTTRGAGRLLFDDKAAGSQSVATQRCEKGMLVVQGELIPGRGAPAFISIPLLLTADAKPEDVSAFSGVRLKVKLLKGNLSIQVASADVTNFDYHTAPVVGKRGELVEVRVPFKDLKRAWSEQTPLNLKAVTSVNLVAFAMARESFAYEVDEISFY